MPKFSQNSINRLRSCDERLQMLFESVVEEYDCSILVGHRTEDEQNRAFFEGKSKLQFPNSKHNTMPSRAVDVVPWPIDWSDVRRFYFFAGYVISIARRMNIKIRWGGDWDRDGRMNDQNFMDLVHFELLD